MGVASSAITMHCPADPKSDLVLADDAAVGMTLRPAGVGRRSWLRFHSRLPLLALPDEACGREVVEVECRPGDWWCRVGENTIRRGRCVRTTLAVSVAEVPGHRAAQGIDGGALLARLPDVGGPVLLHAHLRDERAIRGRHRGGGVAHRFLDHLDALEAAGVDLSAVRPGFWGHAATAAEVGHPLPWPGIGDREVSDER